MFQTLLMKQAQSDDRPVENRISNVTMIHAVLAAGVIVGAIGFFSCNPTRIGEITVATPHGPSVSFKVADSNEISELIRKGLENEKTADFLINSLLTVIESLPSGSKLGEKLLQLAEQRRSPFSSNSVPVKLVYDSEVPNGLAAVCEKSAFSARNIAIFVFNEQELLHTVQAYADPKIVFPCPEDGETVRLNLWDVLTVKRDKVLVKRAL